MTVEQLIRQLEKFPKSRRVLVDGYEDGYSELHINELRVRKENTKWWSGDYQDASRDDDAAFNAVVLRRSGL